MTDPAEDKPPFGQQIARKQFTQPGQPRRAIRTGHLPAPVASPPGQPQQHDDAHRVKTQAEDHGIEQDGRRRKQQQQAHGERTEFSHGDSRGGKDAWSGR